MSYRPPTPWSTCALKTATASTLSACFAKPAPTVARWVLTGYGNIATAVNAVKLGAVDYLSKPADAEDILAALTASRRSQAEAAGEPHVG